MSGAGNKFLSGNERFFSADDIIVSKTDPRGRITYCNRTFVTISGYSETELLGAPHSILRHPDMPRTVFKLLWDRLHSGREVFAYVINRCKNGDHYWVFAHVTPSLSMTGDLVGCHSSRRVPPNAAVETVKSVYASLLNVERKTSDPKQGLAAGAAFLDDLLQNRKVDYDEFVFSL